jgi:hypothetical protein
MYKGGDIYGVNGRRTLNIVERNLKYAGVGRDRC